MLYTFKHHAARTRHIFEPRLSAQGLLNPDLAARDSGTITPNKNLLAADPKQVSHRPSGIR